MPRKPKSAAVVNSPAVSPLRAPKAAKVQESDATLAAVSRSQALIEFAMDGTILHANDHLLKIFGYTLDEIKGRHAGIFADEATRQSPAFRAFWDALNRGECQTGDFRRIDKSGREVWIKGSYNPVSDAAGKPFKVTEFVADITTEKLKTVDYAGQVAAINKSQAVIEFAMDGTILA